MNLNTKSEIKSTLKNAFSSIDVKDDYAHESKMIMYRFLSEVERISDEKKLNRKELATLIGKSASYITQLFRGNKLINMEMIAKFQKVFDVTFEVKAIPNAETEAFKDINVGNICEQQKHPEGFWAFHRFNPEYSEQPDQDHIPAFNFNERTA